MKQFPVIDPVATGENILRLRKEKGLSVRDLQVWFGFEEPQAIYKWQKGKSLPTIDNLYALGALLEVPMEDILVSCFPKPHMTKNGQQVRDCCPNPLSGCFEYGKTKNPWDLLLLLFSGAVPYLRQAGVWKPGEQSVFRPKAVFPFIRKDKFFSRKRRAARVI